MKIRETISSLKKEAAKRGRELAQLKNEQGREDDAKSLRDEIEGIEKDVREHERVLCRLCWVDRLLVAIGIVVMVRIGVRFCLERQSLWFDWFILGLLAWLIGWMAILHSAQWPSVFGFGEQNSRTVR
jgi:hypothetical protein